MDWFGIAQQLISAGHQPDRIRRYTLAQLQGFLTVIAEQEEKRFEHHAAHQAVAVGQLMGGV